GGELSILAAFGGEGRSGGQTRRPSRAAAEAVGRRHPQHDGVPGDTEMKTLLLFAAAALQAQTLDPASLRLFQPPKDTWPTYDGADDREEPRDRRGRRGRDGRSGVPGVAGSGDGRVAVALVLDAGEEGRAGVGDVADRRRHVTRRRHDMDAGDLRSGTQLTLLG